MAEGTNLFAFNWRFNRIQRFDGIDGESDWMMYLSVNEEPDRDCCIVPPTPSHGVIAFLPTNLIFRFRSIVRYILFRSGAFQSKYN